MKRKRLDFPSRDRQCGAAAAHEPPALVVEAGVRQQIARADDTCPSGKIFRRMASGSGAVATWKKLASMMYLLNWGHRPSVVPSVHRTTRSALTMAPLAVSTLQLPAKSTSACPSPEPSRLEARSGRTSSRG